MIKSGMETKREKVGKELFPSAKGRSDFGEDSA